MAESIIIEMLNNLMGMVQSFAPAGTNAFTFLLTFFLIFTIAFTSVNIIPAFKTQKNKKAIGVMIALAVAYFSSTSPLVLNSVERVFPAVGIIIIGAAAFMLTIYFVMPNAKSAEKYVSIILGPIVIGAILLVTWGAITQWQTPLFAQHPDGIIIAGLLITHYDIAILIIILVVIIFMAWMIGGTPSTDSLEKLSKILRGS